MRLNLDSLRRLCYSHACHDGKLPSFSTSRIAPPLVRIFLAATINGKVKNTTAKTMCRLCGMVKRKGATTRSMDHFHASLSGSCEDQRPGRLENQVKTSSSFQLAIKNGEEKTYSISERKQRRNYSNIVGHHANRFQPYNTLIKQLTALSSP